MCVPHNEREKNPVDINVIKFLSLRDVCIYLYNLT